MLKQYLTAVVCDAGVFLPAADCLKDESLYLIILRGLDEFKVSVLLLEVLRVNPCELKNIALIRSAYGV